MLVNRIMRKPVTVITPDTPVRVAAALMGELDIGALPVCHNGCPVGIVTDRDIVTRWASRFVSDGPIEPIMTLNVVTCRVDHTIAAAADLMSDRQIRRLVVLNDAGQVAGMVSLGDIAFDACEERAGQVLGEVVERR